MDEIYTNSGKTRVGTYIQHAKYSKAFPTKTITVWYSSNHVGSISQQLLETGSMYPNISSKVNVAEKLKTQMVRSGGEIDGKAHGRNVMCLQLLHILNAVIEIIDTCKHSECVGSLRVCLSHIKITQDILIQTFKQKCFIHLKKMVLGNRATLNFLVSKTVQPNHFEEIWTGL